MVRQEDIIKPLIFLDIFDYPPTAMELWRFLPMPAELGEISPLLPKEGFGGGYGFYFLSGHEALVEKRREFFYLSEKKFKIAKRAAWLLRFIPSVKMIALCNNFYYRPESDIDFFIIAAPGRLWLTRFFATIILDLFCLRARGKKTADRICLSFYLSEDNLNLENIALKNGGGAIVPEGCGTHCASREDSQIGCHRPSPSSGNWNLALWHPQEVRNDKEIDDPYLSYWLAFLELIYGQECYNKFWQANSWLKNIFPNIQPRQPVSRRRIEDNFLSLGIKKIKSIWFYGALGDAMEKITKKIQWHKLSPKIKEMAASGGTQVIINDQMLKFHENDRREFFKEELRKRANKF
jgi:hypothetical protein